jgi:hypothetical protein
MDIHATSDERHRLKKLMKGNNGTTFQDAHNEKIDDSIDAGAKEIHSTFKDGNLEEIYNNGKSMDEKDLTNYIKLDSVKNDESSDEEREPVFVEEMEKKQQHLFLQMMR